MPALGLASGASFAGRFSLVTLASVQALASIHLASVVDRVIWARVLGGRCLTPDPAVLEVFHSPGIWLASGQFRPSSAFLFPGYSLASGTFHLNHRLPLVVIGNMLSGPKGISGRGQVRLRSFPKISGLGISPVQGVVRNMPEPCSPAT